MSNPPMAVTLSWQGDLRFEGQTATGTILLDGDSTAGQSPVHALACAIAGCMAMDVVDIVRKGRHEVRTMTATFTGDRAETHPRRFVRIALSFVLHGNIPPAAVERAIALSRERYCSVSNSLRPDIEFITSFEVRP
jgi:putative redox protein